MAIEIWRDVPGFEGIYAISNSGRIKSLPRKWRPKEKILSGGSRDPRRSIALIRNKKPHRFTVAMLMETVFKPEEMEKREKTRAAGSLYRATYAKPDLDRPLADYKAQPHPIRPIRHWAKP